MYDTDTFLTTLYVMCDDLCKPQLAPETPDSTQPNPQPRMGRPASLTRSEVLTLSLFGAWGRFTSERDFWRWAMRNGKAAFPSLPERSTFHRLRRAAWPELLRLFEALSEQALSQEMSQMLYQVMDTTALVTRNFCSGDAQLQAARTLLAGGNRQPGLLLPRGLVLWLARAVVRLTTGRHHRLWALARLVQRPTSSRRVPGRSCS